MTKEIKSIKRWLKIEGNTEALLASRMGYKSSASISMWLKRNSVPDYQKEKLKEALQ